jgi:hypothetical protein
VSCILIALTRKIINRNLRNRKRVTMRRWQKGRKSSISYDR